MNQQSLDPTGTQRDLTVLLTTRGTQIVRIALAALVPLAIFLRFDVFGPLMPKVIVEIAQRWL